MSYQHSQEQETMPPEAGRVTTEELAKAVASLEARRQEEAHRLAGTVVIGEAVRELNIDLTPEEILAEVKTQRAHQDEERYRQRLRQTIHRKRGGVAILVGLTFATLILAAEVSRLHLAAGPAVSSPPVTTQGMPPYLPPPPPLDYNADTRQPGYGPAFTSLEAIPNEHPFWCDKATVGAILRHTHSARLFVYGERYHDTWQCIKHGGRVYLRGLASGQIAAQARTSGPILLFNEHGHLSGQEQSLPELGANPIRLTIPVAGLKYYGLYAKNPVPIWQGEMMPGGVRRPDVVTDEEMFGLGNVHLDQHAWEKW